MSWTVVEGATDDDGAGLVLRELMPSSSRCSVRFWDLSCSSCSSSPCLDVLPGAADELSSSTFDASTCNEGLRSDEVEDCKDWLV